MKVGDLVINIYTREIGIMTAFDSNDSEYVDDILKRGAEIQLKAQELEQEITKITESKI